MKFIATYTTGNQITEDSWERISPTIEVTEETTIKEIFDWYRKRNKTELMEIKVIQVEITPH